MLAICPQCGISGSVQIRGKSVRVGHYVGYKGETRIVQWHPTTLENLDLVNNGKQLMVNNVEKSVFSIDYHERQTHNLAKANQMRNLETNGAKRPMPEVEGSNPSPRIEYASIRENGTKTSPTTPQKYQGKPIVYHLRNGKEATYIYGAKPLTEFQRLANVMAHNNWEEFLDLYSDFLTSQKKLCKEVAYEYVRIAKKFLEPIKALPIDVDSFDSTRAYIRQFLDIENPNSYRNTLACLKNLFELLGRKEDLAEFKYKAVMPSFNIATPSLEDMVKFGKTIEHKRTKIYYYLGVVSAIRPQHLLRLRKRLFDKNNNMINTWMKTFGKKNFFFSFYTSEVKPLIEEYVDSLPMDSLLFPYAYRFVQDEFEKTSKKCGIKMSPKMMRKFTTNWLRRHGMISEDVDVLTSHTPQKIVAKHYMDVSRIHEEYDRATKDMKLL